MIMAKKMAFGGVKKMRGGGTSSRGSASSSSASKPSSSSYISTRDRFDGGGKGKSGPTFSGGPFSGIANAIGIKPLAAQGSSGGGGGADSGQAAARVEAQRAAGLAARNYKGNPDNFGGKGPSAAPATAETAAATPAAPVKVMKRTYMGPPPKGYDAGKQGEYTYFKSEMVDAPAKPMKKGGKVRGCGCATRGTKTARMV